MTPSRSVRLVIHAARAVFVVFTLAASALASAQTYSCTTSIGTNVAFGVYDPSSGTPGLASATAQVTCTHTGGGSVRVGWDMQLASGGSGNCTARRMNGPSGSTLTYNIYQNSVASGVWGSASCGSYPSGQFQLSPGNPNNQKTATNVLYGQLPTGQFGAAAGGYSDTLRLTVTWNTL